MTATSANTPRGSGPGGCVGLGATAVLMLLFFLSVVLLSSCLRTPPAVFAEGADEPRAEPPELVLDERVSECPIIDLFAKNDEGPATVLPASVVVDGKAVCFGHVISVTKGLELTHSEDVADYWAARSGVCERYREHDRSYCQSTYEAKWREAEELRRQGAWLRIGVVVAFAGGALFGGAVAVGIVRALDLSAVP